MKSNRLKRGAKGFFSRVKTNMKEAYYHATRPKGQTPYSHEIPRLSTISGTFIESPRASMLIGKSVPALPSLQLSRTANIDACVMEAASIAATPTLLLRQSSTEPLEQLPGRNSNSQSGDYTNEDLLWASEHLEEVASIQPLMPASPSLQSLQNFIRRESGFGIESHLRCSGTFVSLAAVAESETSSQSTQKLSPDQNPFRRAHDFDYANRHWASNITGDNNVRRNFQPGSSPIWVHQSNFDFEDSENNSRSVSTMSDESENHEWRPISPVRDVTHEEIEDEIQQRRSTQGSMQMRPLSPIAEMDSMYDLARIDEDAPSVEEMNKMTEVSPDVFEEFDSAEFVALAKQYEDKLCEAQTAEERKEILERYLVKKFPEFGVDQMPETTLKAIADRRETDTYPKVNSMHEDAKIGQDNQEENTLEAIARGPFEKATTVHDESEKANEEVEWEEMNEEDEKSPLEAMVKAKSVEGLEKIIKSMNSLV